MLRIPILEGARDSFFNWGVWIEVDKAMHDFCVRSWIEDISAQPRAAGRLANRIQAYEGAMGLPVEIEFRPGTDRPSVWLKLEVDQALALERRNGITDKRHHDILPRSATSAMNVTRNPSIERTVYGLRCQPTASNVRRPSCAVSLY